MAFCNPRRSLVRTSAKSRRWPPNRKPGNCAACGTWIPRGEGCLDVQGIHSTLYC